LAWLALILIVMASPPFSWFVDGVFLVLSGLWVAVWNLDWSPRELRITTSVLLSTLVTTFTALEIRHRNLPVISGQVCDHPVVIGDSISSGLDPRFLPWPAVMQQMTGTRVQNMARVGAFSADGVGMASKVMSDDRVVLIEIGGNDLIAGMPLGGFEQSLETILLKLATPGRTVVMFELPLLPHQIAYGQVQRRLATKYRVPIIPRRFLVQVIRGSNATSDGLHLLPEGTKRMTELVDKVLAPVLKPSKSLSRKFSSSFNTLQLHSS
jgi:lysophospholipase L1-like esterase